MNASQTKTGSQSHKPHTIQELTRRNVETIHRLERAAKLQRTRVDQFVDAITSWCGSMAFVWFHIAWLGGWIFWNEARVANLPRGWHERAFDPFPFPLLTLVLSIEAILLSTFIMISQNRQQKLDERRNHLDLQINLLTEQENTKMLRMMNAIAHHLGVQIEDDPDVEVLEEATRPDQLVRQIERTLESENTTRNRKHKAR